MNDTEWYLIGGLIAAGVVIFILLFLLFRRRKTVNRNGSDEKRFFNPEDPDSDQDLLDYLQVDNQERSDRISAIFYTD